MCDLSPEQQTIRDTARRLAISEFAPRAAEIDRTERYPRENVTALREAGLLGMTIPEPYGGPGRSCFDAVLAVEEVARACGATARILVETNMGAIGAIMAYGTEEQKRLAASLVLAGDKPAICITEPEAGSAATSMRTRAVRRGDVYLIDGRKHWITGGGISRLHLVFARVFEGGEEQGIGGFLAVRGETPGLVVGRREPTMGLRGLPETEILFEEMEVPAAMALVPPGGFRRGFASLMRAYNAQRVGAAAVALGIARGAYDLARDYALTREQFGRPIAEFQGLQWMLADMSIRLAAAQALVHRAARSGGEGFPEMTAAAQAKVLAAETAIAVTNDALQIFGAAGYSRNLPVERMLRDARMFTIGGGTVQILRNQIAAGILGRKFPQTRDGRPSAEPPSADRRDIRLA